MKSWADFGIDLPSSGGAERYTTCPRCSHERRKKGIKCLSVNIDKEVWVCHHCGWTGTLKGGPSSERSQHWNKPDFRTPPPIKTDNLELPESVLSWFKSRGISPNTLRRFSVAFTSRVYMPQVEDWVSAIQFPFFRQGKLVNIKYRQIEAKHFRLAAGAERIFYGYDDISDTMTIIVEGEMDKLALAEAGIDACISVPDGAPSPDSKNYANKFSFMDSAQERLSQVKHFVLAVDNDPPGQRLAEELIHRLGKDRCSLVRWPEGCKDANDVLMKHGTDKLIECIYDSELPPIDGILRVSDIQDRIDSLYENGMAPGVNVGWINMELFYNVSPGQWTVVTGIPGHGKSEFLDAMLINLAELHGWTFGMFSPENQPMELHVSKLIEKHARKPFAGGGLAKMSQEEMRAARDWVNQHFFFIHPHEDDSFRLDAILDLAQAMVGRYGIRGMVIDPWNELEHNRPDNASETEYISRCLSLIRRFARKHDVHVWVVAHPTKMTKIVGKDGKSIYPVPTPYDIAGSANFRNKADNALCVYRPDVTRNDQPTEIHVQKIRFKRNGRPGKTYLDYDSVTGRYLDSNQQP